MKNKVLRISLVILLLAVLTMSIISGTLAKYVETVSGTDTARVAKFAYKAKVGETEFAATPVSINLFNTVNDTELYGNSANLNGEAKLVAPGTYGSFDVVVDNTSEVKVNVSFSITETNSGIPIVYYIDNGTTKTYYSGQVAKNTVLTVGSDVATATGAATVTVTGDLTDMASSVATTLNATDGTEAGKTTATYTIGWFWAFGDGTTAVDTADTTLGKAATASVTANIGVTFTQVD